MRIISLILLIFSSNTTYSQSKIIGRILDYESLQPLSSVTISSETPNSKVGAVSGGDGTFAIENIEFEGKVNVKIIFVSYETLIIREIDISSNELINLGNIYLFEGSYIWDGECIKKYLFGLIKIKRGCSGEMDGFIEKNRNAERVAVRYPKNGNEATFDIINNSLEIDYLQIKNNNVP